MVAVLGVAAGAVREEAAVEGSPDPAVGLAGGRLFLSGEYYGFLSSRLSPSEVGAVVQKAQGQWTISPPYFELGTGGS